MGIDASIPLQGKLPQFENPLNQLAQFSQIRAEQGKNRLLDLEFQKNDRAVQQENALSALWKSAVKPDGTLDRNALYTGAAQGGLGSQIPNLQASFQKFDKGEADIGKTKAESEKTSFETFKAKKDYVVQNLTGVLSQPVITDASIAQIAKGFMDNGINDPLHVMQMVASLPPEADQAGRRAAIKSMLMGNMKAEDQMRYSAPDANTIANNRTSAANNAATVGATMRGQDMSQQTAIRGQNITREGQNQPKFNADAGGFISAPDANNPSGKITPLPGFNKGAAASEDERKAAGWLAQADNAWKNMQTVMLNKDGTALNTDVVKPGMLENSAKGLGLEQTANWLRSADRQKFVQGASSLSEALLRAATGAGMNVYEAKQKVEEITPTLNDSDEAMQQKLASIPVYLESLKARAGRAAPKNIDLTTVKPGTNDFDAVMADARRIGALRNKTNAAPTATGAKFLGFE